MKADSSQDSFSGQKVVAIYLCAVLVLASVATTSPWLHSAFEHLSFSRELAHTHAANHYFKHSHSSKAKHSHPHTASPESGDDKDDSPSDHEHHGLSALLASGLLDVSDGSVSVPLPNDRYTDFSITFSNADYQKSFDFIQAQRPPPALG